MYKYKVSAFVVYPRRKSRTCLFLEKWDDWSEQFLVSNFKTNVEKFENRAHIPLCWVYAFLGKKGKHTNHMNKKYDY